MTPRTALRLTATEAAVVLDDWVAQDRSSVADLAGWWVPQVSSKCQGIEVDLGPNFRPDGVAETRHVSEPEILALHAALDERYAAVTTTASKLGVNSDDGACASLTLWVSLVPERFPTGQGALQWCEAEAIPVGECAARKVVPPGQSGTQLMLRQGA